MRLLLPLLLAATARGAPQADLVDSLPGWSGPLPSKIYSGFLNITGSAKRLHYVLVEAEQPLDPATAPVVLWLIGGPGCSSLEGFFYEHGPLVVSDAHAPPNANWDGRASTNDNRTSTLVKNEWAWSTTANVLYLEAPAGVGFSYSPVKKDLTTGDNQTAADSLAALEAFFALKFPELKENPFYVSGESYGGVYVPTLSLKIYQSGLLPQMRGYLVGNGVFDFEDSAPTHVPFAYGHGFLSTAQFTEITSVCKGEYVKPSEACQNAVAVIDDMMVDTNGYDAYRTCYQPDQETFGPVAISKIGSQQAGRHHPLVRQWLRQRLSGGGGGGRRRSRHGKKSAAAAADVGAGVGVGVGVGESVPCINSVKGTKYLNLPEVRRALHVDVSPNTWAICGGVNYEDDGVFKSMLAVHREILAMQREGRIKHAPKILVYNGDVDPGCNYLWAEASVAKFGLSVYKPWKPWVYKDALVGEQLGGFVTTYGPAANVTFATVHGAGHMSPQWRPEAVQTMLSRFLSGAAL